LNPGKHSQVRWINLQAARERDHTLPQHFATEKVSSLQQDGLETVHTGGSAS
jgi:hypothetical protein